MSVQDETEEGKNKLFLMQLLNIESQSCVQQQYQARTESLSWRIVCRVVHIKIFMRMTFKKVRGKTLTRAMCAENTPGCSHNHIPDSLLQNVVSKVLYREVYHMVKRTVTQLISIVGSGTHTATVIHCTKLFDRQRSHSHACVTSLYHSVNNCTFPCTKSGP